MIANPMAVGLLACFALLPVRMDAQTPPPPAAVEAAKQYGFTEDELQKIKGGAVLGKDLREKSDKELAGVVAIFLPKH